MIEIKQKEMPEEVAIQVGNVVQLHLICSMIANNCAQKAQLMVSPYGKSYTREAKQMYNDIIRMSKKLNDYYSVILDDAIPALELKKGSPNSDCDKFDAVNETANIFTHVLDKLFAISHVNNKDLRSVFEVLDKYAGDTEFFNENTRNGLINLPRYMSIEYKKDYTLNQDDKEYVQRVYKKYNYNVVAAADAMLMSESTLRKLLKANGITKEV